MPMLAVVHDGVLVSTQKVNMTIVTAAHMNGPMPDAQVYAPILRRKL